MYIVVPGESRLEYNMADSLLALNGFGDLEGEFRWIRAQEASVSCPGRAGALLSADFLCIGSSGFCDEESSVLCGGVY